MDTRHMQSTSLWMATKQPLSYLPLSGDTEADVCVVGAGMAGMMCAYYLAQAGKHVVVVDDGAIGLGETGRTSAHLASALDDRLFALEQVFGEEKTRLAVGSHSAAIEAIERVVRSEEIDCDFGWTEGFLFCADSDGPDLLDRELEAARRAGFDDARILPRIPGYPFESGPCLYFPDQARFHPLKFVSALAQIVATKDSRIYTGTHAVEIEDGKRPVVRTTRGSVTADTVVVATNTPINDKFSIHSKQAAYRTYMIGAPVPKGSVPDILVWDTGDPYHYIRIDDTARDDCDILLIGGEDHRTGHGTRPEDRWTALEEWARERFDMIQSVEYHWSGQVMEPIDSLAFIGRNPGNDNVYIATGDSGHGLTHGAIAGMLLTDLIMGRNNPWEELYSPSRITVEAETAREFLQEGINSVTRYAQYITRGDVPSEEDIEPGCGAVIRNGLRKFAVYRDNDGDLHRMSAVCPHLGCIVDWNNAEKTWDCPCHGSRFTPYGKVVNGPASTGLTPDTRTS